MTDWRVLKFHRLRELEFPSAKDLVIDLRMNRAEPDQKGDEKSRGLRPWEAVRASKVRRARKLLKDPAYPSKKTLDAVADVLARGLTGKPASPQPPTS